MTKADGTEKLKLLVIFASGLHRNGSCQRRQAPDKPVIPAHRADLGESSPPAPPVPFREHLQSNHRTSGQGAASLDPGRARWMFTIYHGREKCLPELAWEKLPPLRAGSSHQ